MNKSAKIATIVIVLAVAGSFIYSYFNKEEQARAVKPPSFASVAIPVEVAVAEKGVLERTINAAGDVAARNRVSVYSKVEGRVVELRVERGDRVERGQLLARVEDEALKARVAEAEAALEVARARWAQMEAGLRPEELEQARDEVQKAEAEFKNTKLNLERAKELFTKGFFSPQQLDEARLRHTSADAFLNSAREKLKMAEEGYRTEDRQATLAQLHQAEASLRMAEIRLSEARITSPITGVIGEKLVDEGAFVHVSTGILSIVDMDTVKVLINIAEKDIPYVKSGQGAQITVDAYPEQVFIGKVDRISPVVDPESRTAEVQILVPNKMHKLKPGMFARVRMVVARRENAVLVPADVPRTTNGRAYLFIHQKGKALKRQVTLGMRDGDRVEVMDNLEPGEEVIVGGLARLKHDSPVRVVRKRDGK